MRVWSHRTQFSLLLLLSCLAGCTSEPPTTSETGPTSKQISSAHGAPVQSANQGDRVASRPRRPFLPSCRLLCETKLIRRRRRRTAGPTQYRPDFGIGRSRFVGTVIADAAGVGDTLFLGTPTEHDRSAPTHRSQPRCDRGEDGSGRHSTIVSPGGLAILAIPFSPPQDYRWTVVVERTSGKDSVCLVLPVGTRETMVVLEGWQEQVSGLNFVSGVWAYNNVTTYRGPIFHTGAATTLVCTVRQSTVTVECNGTMIINWSGSPSELSLDRRYWNDVPPGRLAVTVYDPQTRFRFTRMDIESLGDNAGSIPSTFGNAHLAGSPGSATGSTSSQPGSGATADRGLPETATRRKESVALEHPIGSGTGFVVGKNLLATNAHVVEGSFIDEIQVHFASEGAQRQRPRRILYEDEVCDLCILKST